jgi:hypothetical protein
MISKVNIAAAKAQVVILERRGKEVPHILRRIAGATPDTTVQHRNRHKEELMPAPGGQIRLSVNVSPETAEKLKGYAAATQCTIAEAIAAATEKLEWVHE